MHCLVAISRLELEPLGYEPYVQPLHYIAIIWKVKTESNRRWQSQILLCYHYTTHQLLVFDLLNYNNSSMVSSSSLKKCIATLRQIGLDKTVRTSDPIVPNDVLYQPELYRELTGGETGI